MRSRRGSATSASAPAGTVRRNIGPIVATCTADTISGFGLSRVISQLMDVSNIAIPTLDSAVAVQDCGEGAIGEHGPVRGLVGFGVKSTGCSRALALVLEARPDPCACWGRLATARAGLARPFPAAGKRSGKLAEFGRFSKKPA